MLVLVTRPHDQATRTAEQLAAMGHKVLVDPVLEIRPRPIGTVDPAGIAALAITSANAAPALPAAGSGHLPVFAVGGATAEAARAAGCVRLHVAEGDGHGLAELIGRELSPERGAILHLAGAEVRAGFAERLAELGFACRRVIAYEAVPSPCLGRSACAALGEGRLGAVLFYSPRTARIWAGHVREAGLVSALERVVAVCLSAAVAAEIAGLPFKERRIAAATSQDALLRCLEGSR